MVNHSLSALGKGHGASPRLLQSKICLSGLLPEKEHPNLCLALTEQNYLTAFQIIGIIVTYKSQPKRLTSNRQKHHDAVVPWCNG